MNSRLLQIFLDASDSLSIASSHPTSTFRQLHIGFSLVQVSLYFPDFCKNGPHYASCSPQSHALRMIIFGFIYAGSVSFIHPLLLPDDIVYDTVHSSILLIMYISFFFTLQQFKIKLFLTFVLGILYAFISHDKCVGVD